MSPSRDKRTLLRPTKTKVIALVTLIACGGAATSDNATQRATGATRGVWDSAACRRSLARVTTLQPHYSTAQAKGLLVDVTESFAGYGALVR